MGDLSAHFSRYEFDCHDGARADPHPDLIAALERLRSICGDRPLHIVSGYRSPAWNRRVGGARASQHLLNRAADLVKGYASVDQALAAGFTGVGFCGSAAVHVDVRTGRSALFRDC
jgi:uncharacterized protein YcbK (DUF882 family)